MVVHYDDEDKNLASIVAAGLIAVKVLSGPAPPKYHVAGDGQDPAPGPIPVPGQLAQKPAVGSK